MVLSFSPTQANRTDLGGSSVPGSLLPPPATSAQLLRRPDENDDELLSMPAQAWLAAEGKEDRQYERQNQQMWSSASRHVTPKRSGGHHKRSHFGEQNGLPKGFAGPTVPIPGDTPTVAIVGDAIKLQVQQLFEESSQDLIRKLSQLLLLQGHVDEAPVPPTSPPALNVKHVLMANAPEDGDLRSSANGCPSRRTNRHEPQGSLSPRSHSMPHIPSRKPTSERRAPMKEAMCSLTAEDGEPHERTTKSAMKGQVFPDASAMKQQVRDAMKVKQYSVADLYHETGWAQGVARHPGFEYITLTVIAINAIWIAIDLDHNEQPLLLDSHIVFQIAEHLFCAYFTFEWAVRFLAFRVKSLGFRDNWFAFDSILLFLMVMETWVMTVFTAFLLQGTSGSNVLGNASFMKLFRMFRLTRMARLMKLLRMFPELVGLIRGIGVAARSVFFTACLMIVSTYVFALVLRQLTDGYPIGRLYFDTVPDAMKNMLIAAIFPDIDVLLNDVGMESWIWLLVLVCFVVLISLTLLNMLIGVLCEVVGVVSAVEKEQLMVGFIRDEMQQLLEECDEAHDDLIDQADFNALLTQPRAVRLFTDVGIDVVALVEYVDVIFKGGKSYEYGDIVALMLDMRGSNTCTVKDIVDLRKWFDKELDLLHAAMEQIQTACEDDAVSPKRSRPLETRLSSAWM
eukprot:TRINITY_DN4556_c0_g1_i4.p1 TRINITY_DN4556_c0_g1~~TRINITY_DN4556_c0_g1_i4.p1  ORF type:complete len:680 (+),score=152.68 TRINITY_DN4556_c0_g1_i4:161-2200(+)